MVTNGKKFTYPGFNEIFTGSPDDRIDKNEKRYNPNVSRAGMVASQTGVCRARCGSRIGRCIRTF